MGNKENIPDWCYRGGSFRFSGKPGKWFKKTSSKYEGQWNKKELIPFGKATFDYRKEYYLCPECDGSLEPMQKEYRFVCPNCRLVFAWGFGGLYGFGADSDRAEYIEKI